MHLTEPVIALIYDTGNIYVASLELETDKIRVFWEDDEQDLTEQDIVSENKFECFTVFDARTDTGDYRTLQDLQEKTQNLINAHQLESNAELKTTHTYETTTYPPA